MGVKRVVWIRQNEAACRVLQLSELKASSSS